MQSFRTEFENPVVERDIIELERKIRLFREGKIDEERFRSLRLARGVYGQRQPGVQMIRIKLPYGRMRVHQLRRIADVADRYSNGNLHTTTRQDIQIHYVKLEESPQLWAELERDEVTLREACGNTVRNVTASATAGIDPDEPFDVTPYADAFFKYFLRNPVCQEMGRKFKVAFSSSEKDSAYAFMHDLGFIPRIEQRAGESVKGFKILIGGGLGAQPVPAQVAFEFLPADEIIPFAESILRVFDRHGERNKRFKARMKFLLKQIGLEELLRLAGEEQKALPYQKYPIDETTEPAVQLPPFEHPAPREIADQQHFQAWLETNVHPQKQPGYYAVEVFLRLGNFSTDTARILASLVEQWAGDDIRITVNQGLLLRYVPEAYLPMLFAGLKALDLAEVGFGSTADITACPGTDTCNLGISSSTGIARELEQLIRHEYPGLLKNRELEIKISGCMNACGQHTIGAIGFHGSTLKTGGVVAPALQVLLGGGILGNGQVQLAEKVIKIPSRRGPLALRIILDDFEEFSPTGEAFHAYFKRQGKRYFYTLLKEVGDAKTLEPYEFLDWGQAETFVPEIGVGECAGVIIDLVETLLYEAAEKLDWAAESLEAGQYADSIYHSYNAFVQGAKALLVADGIQTNSQANIITRFQEDWVQENKFQLTRTFPELVYQIQQEAPTASFAQRYLQQAQAFFAQARRIRKARLSDPQKSSVH